MKHSFNTKRLALLLCVAVTVAALTVCASAESDTEVAYPVTDGNIYFDESTGAITAADSTITEAVHLSNVLSKAHLRPPLRGDCQQS